MGLFGGSKPKSVTEAAAASVMEAVMDSKPQPSKEEQEKKKNNKIVDLLILLILGGLLIFFVIWPLLTFYFFAAIGWVLLWPFMKWMPACANHSFAGPAYRVLTVAVLSPVKLVKMLWDQHKEGKELDEAKRALEEKRASEKKGSAAAAAAVPATQAPAPQVVDKV